MMKLITMRFSLVAMGVTGFFLPISVAAEGRVGTAIDNIHVRGYVGQRLDDCIKNNLMATDVKYLTDTFRRKSEFWQWDTEFWGKFMHSAVPCLRYVGNGERGTGNVEGFRRRIAEGVDAILATQLSDGYIGNFFEDRRANLGWDVWGCKYTLLGLLMQYDVTHEPRVLDGARRLADWLMTQFPAKRPLHVTGGYRGLASGSLLEPIVWLYRHAGEAKYLDFARYIIDELDKAEDGPKLLTSALSGVDMADRPTGDPLWHKGGLKAYEMMSCYQGLLEYCETGNGERETGNGERGRILKAVVMAAENIATTEMNICGGMASEELWYRGATRQTEPYKDLQETCVSITWMRLCEKLLLLTGDPKWADRIERTFYNAYLAALAFDGRMFATYTPLAGTREEGRDHCYMIANCCNANGPRGFLAMLQSVLTAESGVVCVNQYLAGTTTIEMPGGKEKPIRLETYTHYPLSNRVRMRYDGEEPVAFTLNLRMPSWAENTKVVLSVPDGMGLKNENLGTGTPGSYFPIARKWKPGDMVEIVFDMKVRSHELNRHVAFTRGPVVLARDCRFGDGDIGEMLNAPFKFKSSDFACVTSPDSAMRIVCSARLKLGHHAHQAATKEEPLPHEVKFCDYASAGNTWTATSSYRVWLPVECKGVRLR